MNQKFLPMQFEVRKGIDEQDGFTIYSLVCTIIN